jgi:hypothetical protein
VEVRDLDKRSSLLHYLRSFRALNNILQGGDHKVMSAIVIIV